MQLTDADISEFQTCWKEEIGEEIPADRARLEAERLLDFFAMIVEAEHASI